MMDRWQFRIQPISQICKRMRRHKEMKQREQEFEKLVSKAQAKIDKKSTMAAVPADIRI